jgi:CxxC motif-containing protein (DUF1111 family)
MRTTVASSILAMAAITVLGTVGCGGDIVDDSNSAQSAVLGDRVAGISSADFAEAADAFGTIEGTADGLGPIFNDRGCGACHSNGAMGGAGEQIERRFGRFVNGAFDPLAGAGGSLRQLFTLGNWKAGCNVALEREPSTATVHNVGRLTTPLFGLGLVDAMPDSFFDGLAAAEPAAVRGIVNRVATVFPNPRDAGQAVGRTRVGRFGWKAGVPNLVQFSADAYVNEMGITTQSCVRGTSITAFATESAPNGVPVAAGCDDEIPGTDEPVGSCAGGLTEVQEDVGLFANFMTFLAPPPRDFSDQISITRGQPIFTQIGCNGCHVTTTFRTPGTTPNGVQANFNFNPFSDFLVHDMGTLGDQIGNAGDSLAVTRRMRTAPLWGIRFRNHLLHDGRTSDIPTAVRAHDGQGAAARNAFNALSSDNQHNVVQFVRSL